MNKKIAVEIAIGIILIITVIVGGFIWMGNRQQDKIPEKIQQKENVQSQNPIAEINKNTPELRHSVSGQARLDIGSFNAWSTFQDKNRGFQFKYPSIYQIEKIIANDQAESSLVEYYKINNYSAKKEPRFLEIWSWGNLDNEKNKELNDVDRKRYENWKNITKNISYISAGICSKKLADQIYSGLDSNEYNQSYQPCNISVGDNFLLIESSERISVYFDKYEVVWVVDDNMPADFAAIDYRDDTERYRVYGNSISDMANSFARIDNNGKIIKKWLTYNNSASDFAFDYPSSWIFKSTDANKDGVNIVFVIDNNKLFISGNNNKIPIYKQKDYSRDPIWYGICSEDYKSIKEFCQNSSCKKINKNTAIDFMAVHHGEEGASELLYTNISKQNPYMCAELALPEVWEKILSETDENKIHRKLSGKYDIEAYIKNREVSNKTIELTQDFEKFAASFRRR